MVSVESECEVRKILLAENLTVDTPEEFDLCFMNRKRAEIFERDRVDYAPETIDRWLRVFLRRFLSQQFKRAASAEGPAVVALSLDPRDGWQMPGDVQSSAWMD